MLTLLACWALALLVVSAHTTRAERVIWIAALSVIYAGLLYWGCV